MKHNILMTPNPLNWNKLHKYLTHTMLPWVPTLDGNPLFPSAPPSWVASSPIQSSEWEHPIHLRFRALSTARNILHGGQREITGIGENRRDLKRKANQISGTQDFSASFEQCKNGLGIKGEIDELVGVHRIQSMPRRQKVYCGRQKLLGCQDFSNVFWIVFKVANFFWNLFNLLMARFVLESLPVLSHPICNHLNSARQAFELSGIFQGQPTNILFVNRACWYKSLL